MPLDVNVNGRLHEIAELDGRVTLDHVLAALSIRKELVATALNDTIVPRSLWEEAMVSSGDRIEIVHFVGGGCDGPRGGPINPNSFITVRLPPITAFHHSASAMVHACEFLINT